MIRSIDPNLETDFLTNHIDDFPSAKVFVIGDVILDKFIWGDVTRISPEAPVPVVDVRQETKMLGGAANVIRNLATLGSRPVLCGVVGDDPAGKDVLDFVSDLGLSTDGIVLEKERYTSIKTRIVAHSQQVVRFDKESRRNIDGESERVLLTFIERNLQDIDAIIVSDYGKGVITGSFMKELRSLVNKALRHVIIAVDPKTGNFEYYREIDVITPNHFEAGIYCGFDIVDEETLEKAGNQMLKELNCRSVLITQGKDGMTLFEKGEKPVHIPTVARKVYDVTGAGDTVIGTFALSLASGLDLKSAAILSNFAAGIVVGEIGTSTVKADELKKALNSSKKGD